MAIWDWIQEKKYIGFWRNKILKRIFVFGCIHVWSNVTEKVIVFSKKDFADKRLAQCDFGRAILGCILGIGIMLWDAEREAHRMLFLQKRVKSIFCILFCRRKSELCEHTAHHCNGRLACSWQDLHCKKAFSVPELDWNQYKRYGSNLIFKVFEKELLVLHWKLYFIINFNCISFQFGRISKASDFCLQEPWFFPDGQQRGNGYSKQMRIGSFGWCLQMDWKWWRGCGMF